MREITEKDKTIIALLDLQAYISALSIREFKECYKKHESSMPEEIIYEKYQEGDGITRFYYLNEKNDPKG